MNSNLPDGCTDADTEIGGRLSSKLREYEISAQASIYIKIEACSLEEAKEKAAYSDHWIIDEIETDTLSEN